MDQKIVDQSRNGVSTISQSLHQNGLVQGKAQVQFAEADNIKELPGYREPNDTLARRLAGFLVGLLASLLLAISSVCIQV